MPRIELLQQGSVLQQHTGKYTIGYAISNNDFDLMENAFISAENIINNHVGTADNLSARAMLKGFLETLDAFKTWKNQFLKSIDTSSFPSNSFLELPNNECTITLVTKIDDDKPSQILEFEMLDVRDLAKSLRIAYELVTDLDEFDTVTHVAGLLEIFESFIATYDAKHGIT